MLAYILSVLGGISPRPAPTPTPAPPSGGSFQPPDVLASILAIAVGPSDQVWVAGDGGLLDPTGPRLLAWPEPLTWVAAGSFVAAGSARGLLVLREGRLTPVEPAEPVLGLVAVPGRILATSRAGPGLALRAATGAGSPWHLLARLGPGSGALASDGVSALVGTEAGLVRVDLATLAITRLAPFGADPAVVGVAVLEGRALVRLRDGTCMGLDLADPVPVRIPLAGVPGLFKRALALGAPGRVSLVPPAPEGLAPPPAEVPAGLADQPLVPAGEDGRGVALAWNGRAVLQAGRRAWRPSLVAGLVPRRARELRRTRAGALWAVDPQGRVHHRSPDGTWTAMVLPDGMAAEGRVGVDGEALLMACRAGPRAHKPGAGLFWLSAPRGEEVGGWLPRAPEPVPMGVFEGSPPRAMAALGSTILAAVGGRILAVRGDRVETWGVDQGLPDAPILDLAALYEDLWVLCQGEPPFRLPGGRLPLERPVADGPGGQGVALAADEESGQLWVALADGAKGGAASLSREGVWITQLRLPGPARAVSAAGGTVAVATGAGLAILEGGERIRRIYGVEDGLPELDCQAVGMAGPEVWADAGGLRRWRREEAAAPGPIEV